MEQLVTDYPEALFILTTRDEVRWCQLVKQIFHLVDIALERIPLLQLTYISA